MVGDTTSVCGGTALFTKRKQSSSDSWDDIMDEQIADQLYTMGNKQPLDRMCCWVGLACRLTTCDLAAQRWCIDTPNVKSWQVAAAPATQSATNTLHLLICHLQYSSIGSNPNPMRPFSFSQHIEQPLQHLSHCRSHICPPGPASLC